MFGGLAASRHGEMEKRRRHIQQGSGAFAEATSLTRLLEGLEFVAAAQYQGSFRLDTALLLEQRQGVCLPRRWPQEITPEEQLTGKQAAIEQQLAAGGRA